MSTPVELAKRYLAASGTSPQDALTAFLDTLGVQYARAIGMDQSKFKENFLRLFDCKSIEEEVANRYAQGLSELELGALVTFFESPEGKAYVATRKTIDMEMQPVIQERMRKVLVKLGMK